MSPIHICFASIVMLLCPGAALAQLQDMTFDQLPEIVRDHAIEVRKSCKEYNSELVLGDEMMGINVLSLDRSGTKGLFVDNKELCGEHLKGANCSNRGCDFLVYREISRGLWKKIFEEHLYDRHLAIDWDTMRFQSMVASLHAGDPRCRPDPRQDFSSGRSCNLIVRYKNGKWTWQKIK